MIRRSVAEDAVWIRDVAAHVYLALGDYSKIIPAWMAHPGVLTFVEQDPATGEKRGFTLIGFYEPPELRRGQLVADLLAIAVAPAFQRNGVGSALLTHAVALAATTAERIPIPEIRLTVADSNVDARRLFERRGFEVIDAHHGAYDGGQRAVRMRRRLST